MDSLKLVETTGCAAFLTDENGIITAWNQAAAKLLGRPAEEAVGKACAEIICGTDVFGNRFCHEECAIQIMVRDGEPIRNFHIDIRTSNGVMFRAGLCTLVIRAEGRRGHRLVHLLQPMNPEGVRPAVGGGMATSAGGAGTAGSPKAGSNLTAREREVLALLEAGVPTQGMADSMKISVTTVRNHIQGILRKLGAHSRLEAVSSARRQGLV